MRIDYSYPTNSLYVPAGFEHTDVAIAIGSDRVVKFRRYMLDGRRQYHATYRRDGASCVAALTREIEALDAEIARRGC